MQNTPIAKLPFPDLKIFDVKKDRHPLVAFYDWVMREMGETPDGVSFRINVSSVWVGIEERKAWQEFLTKWIVKRYKVRKERAKRMMQWEWLDLGPAEFCDEKDLPEWYEPGYIFVMPDWKLPPTAKFSGGQWYLNNQPVEQEQYKQIMSAWEQD